ncbi:hypothetical protein J6590_103359, partial [Homalodisca vitripennis]
MTKCSYNSRWRTSGDLECQGQGHRVTLKAKVVRSMTDLVGVNDRPCGVNDLSRREGEVIDLCGR